MAGPLSGIKLVEFAGIGNQVEDDLLDSGLVGINGVQILVHPDFNPIIILLRQGFAGLDDILQHFRQAEFLLKQFYLAGFDPWINQGCH